MTPNPIPPVGSDAKASPLLRLALLAWLELRRIVRGWRWRGLFVVLGAAAVVLSRGEMFGYAAAVFFPGGRQGALLAPFIIGLVALVLGAASWGGLERARAGRLAASRLSHPFEFVAARLVAVAASIMLIAFFVAAWPLLGAWRGGLEVLPMPSALYLCAVIAPVVACGAASGMFGRIAAGGDTTGIALGAIAFAPALWFRMAVSDPLDLFLRVSLQLGTLVPAEVIARDASITLLCALPLAGLAVLFLPPQRGRTPLSSGRLDRVSRLATLVRLRDWMTGRLRQAGALAAGLSLVLVALGAPALVTAARSRPYPAQSIDWSRAGEPAGASGGRLPAVRVLHRDLSLGPSAESAVRARIALSSPGAAPQVSAALTFGPALRAVSVARLDGGTARISGRVAPGDSHIATIEFDPPLSATTTTIELSLEVDPRARRRWERGYAPGFRSFAGIESWWGEPVELDFVNSVARTVGRPSTFRVEIPAAPGMDWVCGAARGRDAGPGRVAIESDLPSNPGSLLAARLTETPHPHAGLRLAWLAFPERERLMRSFPEVYRDALGRIERLFGEQRHPLQFYEVPLQETADLMAMPSAVLDRLEFALPRFRDWDSPSEAEFDEAFKPWNLGLVAEIINRSWDSFQDDDLMRTSMILYLHEYGLLKGQTRDMTREARVDAVLAPWKFARYKIDRPPAPPRPQQQGGFGGQGGPPRPFLTFSEEYFPFDIREAESKTFEGPIGPGRPTTLPPVTEARRRAFIHMLRTAMGDEAFCAMIREVYGSRHRGELTVRALQVYAEKHAGRELGWFFRDWAEAGAVPRLRILEVRSVLAENPRTRVIEYRTTARVANRGSGRVEVPWLLQTEGDPVEGTTLLGPGAEEELTIVTLARPTDFAVDPWGSIVSVAEYNPETKQTIHPRVYIKAIAEM